MPLTEKTGSDGRGWHGTRARPSAGSSDRIALARTVIPLLLALICATELVAAGQVAQAAQAAAPTPPSISALAAEVDQADARSQSIALGARLQTIDDAGLRSRLAAIPAIQAELDDALSALEPRLQSADARLNELGPPPGAGQPPEDPEIAQERQTILRFRRGVDTEVKQAKLVGVELAQLRDYLTTRRRDLFGERLWQHDPSPLDYRFWSRAVEALPTDAGRLGALDWLGATSSAPALTWAIALLSALFVLILGRSILIRLGQRRATLFDSPTRLRRAVLALWSVGVAAATSLLACYILRATLDATLPATSPLQTLADILTRAVVFASVFAGVGRALLAPRLPAWRLAPVDDELSERMRRYPLVVGAVVALGAFAVEAAAFLQLSESTTAAVQCLVNFADLSVIVAALVAVTHDANSAQQATTIAVAEPRRTSRVPWALALIAAWLAVTATAVATLSGYHSLGGFILRETVWVATLLALLFLLVGFADELFPALLSPDGRVGSMVRGSLALPSSTFEQAGVLLSGFARVALLLFGWTAVLAPFGAGAQGVFGRLTSSDLVLRFGQVEISPGTIIVGFLVFLAGLAVTRGVRHWLEARYLPTTAMDVGAQTAVGVGISYLGAIVAITVASAYLGLSLDKITLFASALSVGIGFGLQSIIGNFVSGLILLAERPIRIGDWVAIGDLEGDVRRISVRATEIEMRDRSKLIVPNSDLISKTVRNVTRGSALGRLKIVLRVTDTTDPAALRDLVAARLGAHPDILIDPPANVFLTDVRDGALEFTALAYVGSARDAYRVKSELLFQIVPDLKTNGIALASSTPVVNVGLADRAMEPDGTGRAGNAA